MTDQQRAPVNLDELDALDNAVERCLEANRYNDASEALSRLRGALVNAYPDIAAELRSLRAEVADLRENAATNDVAFDHLRAERDKALADLGEAKATLAATEAAALNMMSDLNIARALLARLEGER